MRLFLASSKRYTCARAAARTSVLSHRWCRGLWRHLLELYFLDTPRRALEDALPQIAVPKVSLLHIVPDSSSWCVNVGQRFSTASIASLLRDATRLDPVDLKFVGWLEPKDRGIAAELPCFSRATSINLDVPCLNLTLPAQSGEFPVLERLAITGCLVDIGALISRCPRLRVLELKLYQNTNVILVHSATIEELTVTSYHNNSGAVQGLDIVTPLLKKLKLRINMKKDFAMSFVAPMLENLYWNCRWCWFDFDVCIDGMWCFRHLQLHTGESGCIVLGLDIGRPLVSIHSF